MGHPTDKNWSHNFVLNNIYSLSLQKSDKSPEMILKLSDLMRYMLYDCNVQRVDLEREVQFLQDYIDLEKIRHGDKATINFTVTGVTHEKKVPPLLLIPFVENAFRHGINAQLGNAWVRIDLRLDDHQHDWIFIIENNKRWWEEKLNKDFLIFVWKFHNKNKQEINNKLLGVSKNKVIAVKSKRELRKILSVL